MYGFAVRATNAFGTGPASNLMSAMPGFVPSKPQNVAVKANTAAGVLLTWKAPSSIGSGPVLGYRVYRSTVSNAQTLLATVAVNTAVSLQSFTDTTVQNGTTYYYQLTAFNAVGEGLRTYEKTAKRGTAPTAPRSVTATTNTAGGVTLRWYSPSSNGGSSVTGYKIYRSTSSGTEVLLVAVGNVTSYVDKATTKGVRYYYWVTAVNVLGEGPASSEVTAISG
jgi:fibronectin type 3 domain-containing protein